MVQADVYSVGGSKMGKVSLPSQFEEKVQPELIKRAVIALQSHNYQPYGTDPLAGKRQGYHTSKRRRKYKGTYGSGRSRIRRKHLWHRGTQFAWVGAFVSNAIGGRRAFPPQVDKNIELKMNKKERRKAIRSAIAATQFMIIEDKLETLTKAKDAQKAFENLKLKDKLESSKEKKQRAGRGTLRGRKYKRSKGPLVVVSKKCDLFKSANNIPGVDIVQVKNLNVELLAPGTNMGRTTIWSKGALEVLNKEGLFN